MTLKHFLFFDVLKRRSESIKDPRLASLTLIVRASPLVSLDESWACMLRASRRV